MPLPFQVIDSSRKQVVYESNEMRDVQDFVGRYEDQGGSAYVASTATRFNGEVQNYAYRLRLEDKNTGEVVAQSEVIDLKIIEDVAIIVAPAPFDAFDDVRAGQVPVAAGEE